MTTLPDRPHRVLVVVASRHGGTRQIADAVAGVLWDAGFDADVEDAAGADPAGYDAVVLGSAVYYGRWLPSARALPGSTRPLSPIARSGSSAADPSGTRRSRTGTRPTWDLLELIPRRPRSCRLRRPDRPTPARNARARRHPGRGRGRRRLPGLAGDRILGRGDRGRAPREGRAMSSPMSTLHRHEALQGAVALGVVGHPVLPQAPDHPAPGAGQDALGVGVVLPRARALA